MEWPNLSYIHELSQGDKAFEEEILEVIRHEFPQECLEYQKAVDQKNFDNAAAKVHKLKHKISILGLSKGYQVAVDYENQLRAHCFVGKNDFEFVLDSIDKFLKD